MNYPRKEDSPEYQEALEDVQVARIIQCRAISARMRPDDELDLDDAKACAKYASRKAKLNAIEDAACAAAGVPNQINAAGIALAAAEARLRDIFYHFPTPTSLPAPKRGLLDTPDNVPSATATRAEWEAYHKRVAEARRADITATPATGEEEEEEDGDDGL